MQDFSVMQRFKASDDLNEDIPNLFLLDVGFSLLIIAYFLEDITVVGVLHDQTEELKNGKHNC